MSKTCIYYRALGDCLCNNDPDDCGECIYENGVEPLTAKIKCKYYKIAEVQNESE